MVFHGLESLGVPLNLSLAGKRPMTGLRFLDLAQACSGLLLQPDHFGLFAGSELRQQLSRVVSQHFPLLIGQRLSVPPPRAGQLRRRFVPLIPLCKTGRTQHEDPPVVFHYMDGRIHTVTASWLLTDNLFSSATETIASKRAGLVFGIVTFDLYRAISNCNGYLHSDIHTELIYTVSLFCIQQLEQDYTDR